MPRLSNEDDLDALGEVYGEPPISEQEATLRARAKSVQALMKQSQRRDQKRLRPAPLLERIDEEDVR